MNSLLGLRRQSSSVSSEFIVVSDSITERRAAASLSHLRYMDDILIIACSGSANVVSELETKSISYRLLLNKTKTKVMISDLTLSKAQTLAGFEVVRIF